MTHAPSGWNASPVRARGHGEQPADQYGRPMRLPRIDGEIERRLLVNYRVDPEAVTPVLPGRFRPQLVDGAAVAGISLTRLGGPGPGGVPRALATPSTENAAPRIAVEWDGPEGVQPGVYTPRRDTDSRLTVLLGGRAF